MSDRMEEALEELNEKLDIIELKLDVLVGQLPQEVFNELQDSIRSVKERAWESRMGEDL